MFNVVYSYSPPRSPSPRPCIISHINLCFLCAANRICKEEIEALSEMAQQINTKLSQATNAAADKKLVNGDICNNLPGSTPLIGQTHQQSNESVDLDNLFAFLSEVTPNNSNSNNSNNSTSSSVNNNSSSVLDDISGTMDNLVQDLDIELENVLQQEIEGLALENQPTKPPHSKMGVPSLPEPTMRPPPPPTATKPKPQSSQSIPNGTSNTPKPVANSMPPPSIKANVKRNQHEEPIYEAVIPREELPVVHELPEPHSIENGHKLR